MGPFRCGLPRISRQAGGGTARRRVLVVDDNEDGADALVDMLGGLGHEAVAAYDGPEALERALECAFDTVLDICLPVMDGYELARRLREAHPALRLLAMTATGWKRTARAPWPRDSRPTS